MTEWIDEGIILSTRPFQERGVIVNVLSREHGRCAGFAYHSRPLRQAGAFEVGTQVNLRWTARMTDQLGRFEIEPVLWHAAGLFDSVSGLAALRAICAMLETTLPERESALDMFGATEAILPLLGADFGLALYVKWETLLLKSCGFTLALDACAVTGAHDRPNDRLGYVSPRTGRAVSLSAAEGYEDKLLKLPGFLAGDYAATHDDIADGLRLTGHFLQRHVFDTVHQSMPLARQQLVEFCQSATEKIA